MKGVVLAGGKGTRLRPMTRVMNKHIIPVYGKPLIYYPVQTLIDLGIEEILVVSNAEHIGKYIELLERDFDVNFHYKVQSEPKGIAHGVGLAEDFVDDSFVVILGDNVILDEFSDPELNDSGGKIYLKEVEEPSAYGIATIDGDEVMSIREKPDSPESHHAVIGLYHYDTDVFDIIDELEPSDRGEYEITDVNNEYIERGELEYEVLDGEWFDAGTPEGLYQASTRVRKEQQNES